MRFRNLLLAAAAISVMGLAVGVTGQTMIDGVKVDLPYSVRIGDDTVLEPGEYEIRRASQNQDQVLRIFSNDKMRYETHVITVPALDNDTPENTKVILHRIGDDYYFDKIWIQGKDYGYEFVLPERARALKRELAELPATYVPQAQPGQDTSTQSADAPAATTPPATSAQATPSPTQTQAELDRQAQAERDRQAELAAQADTERNRQQDALAQAEQDRQAQRDANVDSRTAQLQNQNQVQSNAAQQRQQPDADVSGADTARLPATSANWLGWVLGGAALIMLSAIVRSKVSE